MKLSNKRQCPNSNLLNSCQPLHCMLQDIHFCVFVVISPFQHILNKSSTFIAKMHHFRVTSSPNLIPMSTTSTNLEDYSLEGISANVKLLLKLIQEHQEASQKGNIDERKAERFAGIMSILDDVKARLQKAQSTGRKSKAELRRCYTDVKINQPPKDGQKKDESLMLDDKEKLRRDLNTSYAAQKRLGVMCASLGREKDIIARELTRKVQELNEMEQHVNDLRVQNEKLTAKIQTCVAEHKEFKRKDIESENDINYAVFQHRNKELSEQLLKSLEGYKTMKRKLKEVQEERDELLAAMEDVEDEVEQNVQFLYDLKQCVDFSTSGEQTSEIIEKIDLLEHALHALKVKTSSTARRKGKQKV